MFESICVILAVVFQKLHSVKVSSSYYQGLAVVYYCVQFLFYYFHSLYNEEFDMRFDV